MLHQTRLFSWSDWLKAGFLAGCLLLTCPVSAQVADTVLFRYQRNLSFTPLPTVSSMASLSVSPRLLPGYARLNPAGHAPLCRTELLLENRLPVAPWIKVGTDDGRALAPISVQLKLWRF
ncbi:MAG: hypothetical protein SF053_20560 [Bacteroidia bacterium]|nr:hypothetical protein [Bacteroidia bacterium]